MLRRILLFVGLFASPSLAPAQGYAPAEAAKRMQLLPGFTVRPVAAEPMIRQPVSISFDSQGRMWVLQYLQYPNYEGLKPLKQDQFLRTIWDRLPEPPPKGPKGADRLTICYDPDKHGVYRKSQDFLTGLNIASGFCLGNGGVYVAQPPYLLFYPDKNEDDVPDGEPEVLLTGFGMDDTHSLANSLQWGPDGWLYGAAGSTSTCKIKNPATPNEPSIEFQQGIWRYHPQTKRFELFSEGGGNTYGLDFDQNGQIIAGTNYGGVACLHQLQGAYHVKGFSKHGPLHNAHTYGYFEHVPYKGFKGGHVTCGGIVYQADTWPAEYRNQYIAANVLSNDIYWHKLDAVKGSFQASHGGEVVIGNDPWFRPIDLQQGPDGSVYVVDFYDRRAAHLDPIDNWDRTNGRVYKLEYSGTPKLPTFDLRKQSSAELVELLKHPNKWWRNEARRILGERKDANTHGMLKQWLQDERGTLALEALWALHVSGGWTDELSRTYGIKHPNEHVRAWAIRLAGDEPRPEKPQVWFAGAAVDRSPVVLAQLACTARRIHIDDARQVMASMLVNPVCADDPQLSLLMWWAIEDHLTRTKGAGIYWITLRGNSNPPLLLQMAERYVRRLVVGDFEHGVLAASRLLIALPDDEKVVALRGLAKSLEGRVLPSVPEPLLDELERYWAAHPADPLILEIMARMNVPAARIALREKVTQAPDAERVKAIALLAQIHDVKAKELFLAEFKKARTDAVRSALLGGLESFEDAGIGDAVLEAYPGLSAGAKKRAIQTLLTRPVWALALFQRVDTGAIAKTDLTTDHARTAIALHDKALTPLVEKHYGKLTPATPGEKQARITWLNVVLSRTKSGDRNRGQVLFTKHCAACHILHGEGGKIGPDLTTADRKNRSYLLAQIVDPSGYIRPEYVVHNVSTNDGRKLSGIVSESSAETVTLVNVIDNKPQSTTVAKGEIEAMLPSSLSLMPEKLLDTLSEPEIADLFAYLASDVSNPNQQKQPVADTPGSSQAKKLKVCLVSGSFEYKSEQSLTAFKKFLESTYPIECTLVVAKSDKDKSLAGLEALDTCDVAIFFTRRLQIDGESLEKVKKYAASGKPIIGIRTASHGFQNYLQMDKEIFGGDYQGHFGANLVCEVTLAKDADKHALLKDVAAFKSNGSLYKNPNVAKDVTVLLMGTIPKQPPQPVAWVREKDGQRIFYTSLGHPDDFKDDNFLYVLVNAIAWTTKTELKAVK